MKIRRIQIPHFRALQNVDLTFEPGFEQQIFPLGSRNGGGKSTLLQLIFTLLKCSSRPEQHHYLRNILSEFIHPPDEPEKLIASITLSFDGHAAEEPAALAEGFDAQRSPEVPQTAAQDVDLEFLSLGPQFLEEDFDGEGTAVDFEVFGQDPEHIFPELRERLAQLQDYGARIDSTELTPEARKQVAQDIAKELRLTDPGYDQDMSATEIASILDREIRDAEKNVTISRKKIQTVNEHRFRIKRLLKENKLFLITTFHPPSSHSAQEPGPGYYALVARVAGGSPGRLKEQLATASKSIFLLGPSMQQYLFLERAYRRSLVATSESSENIQLRIWPEEIDSAAVIYAREIARAETDLPGFFAYDWLSIEPLLRLFRQARDQDFANAVKTGNYGNHYTTMLAEINTLLHQKHVRPLEDLSGIQFTTQSPGGEEVALDLEDLSRGELKRLMIYAWLKANQTDGGVVLIDEIEVSFHPDWQSGIVRELWEWAPQNQYILATHSYEVCEALTPAHIRELAPKLATNPKPKTNASGS